MHSELDHKSAATMKLQSKQAPAQAGFTAARGKILASQGPGIFNANAHAMSGTKACLRLPWHGRCGCITLESTKSQPTDVLTLAGPDSLKSSCIIWRWSAWGLAADASSLANSVSSWRPSKC